MLLCYNSTRCTTQSDTTDTRMKTSTVTGMLHSLARLTTVLSKEGRNAMPRRHSYFHRV